MREKVKDFTFSERMNYITKCYNISEEAIAYVEDWINNRPMKILNYMTPKQIFQLNSVAIAS